MELEAARHPCYQSGDVSGIAGALDRNLRGQRVFLTEAAFSPGYPLAPLRAPLCSGPHLLLPHKLSTATPKWQSAAPAPAPSSCLLRVVPAPQLQNLSILVGPGIVQLLHSGPTGGFGDRRDTRGKERWVLGASCVWVGDGSKTLISFVASAGACASLFKASEQAGSRGGGSWGGRSLGLLRSWGRTVQTPLGAGGVRTRTLCCAPLSLSRPPQQSISKLWGLCFQGLSPGICAITAGGGCCGVW